VAELARQPLQEWQWRKVEAILAQRSGPGPPGANNRQFIEAILAQRSGPGPPGANNRQFIEAMPWWRPTGVPWSLVADYERR
jgi:hypothetical protein